MDEATGDPCSWFMTASSSCNAVVQRVLLRSTISGDVTGGRRPFFGFSVGAASQDAHGPVGLGLGQLCSRDQGLRMLKMRREGPFAPLSRSARSLSGPTAGRDASRNGRRCCC